MYTNRPALRAFHEHLRGCPPCAAGDDTPACQAGYELCRASVAELLASSSNAAAREIAAATLAAIDEEAA